MPQPGLESQTQQMARLVVETDPGTYNASGQIFDCPDWRPDFQPAGEFKKFRAAGRNADSYRAKAYEQTNFTGEFDPCYNHMDKWLMGLCGDPVVTTRPDDVQSLIGTGTVSGGTFTLTFKNPLTNVSDTTAALDFDAAAADIQTALRGLANYGAGVITCTGGALPGAAIVITFTGSFAAMDVPLLTVDDTLITGGGAVAVTDTTAGVRHREYVLPDKGRRSIYSFTLDWGTEASCTRCPFGLMTAFTITSDSTAGTAGTVGFSARDPIATEVPMTGGVNGVQTITPTGTISGGTYKLTLTHPLTGRTAQTAALAFDATNAEILTALVALSIVAAGDIVLSGGPLPGVALVVTFQNDWGAVVVPLITIQPSLTGSTPVLTVTQTTAGAAPTALEADVLPILWDHWAYYRSNAASDLTGTIDTAFHMPNIDAFEFTCTNLVAMFRSHNRTRTFSSWTDGGDLQVEGNLRAPTKDGHVVDMLADIDTYISGPWWLYLEAACPDGVHLFAIKWRAAVGDNVPVEVNQNIYERRFPLGRIIDPGNANGGSVRFITEVAL